MKYSFEETHLWARTLAQRGNSVEQGACAAEMKEALFRNLDAIGNRLRGSSG